MIEAFSSVNLIIDNVPAIKPKLNEKNPDRVQQKSSKTFQKL